MQTAPAEGQPFDHGVFELAVEAWPEHEMARARSVVAGEEHRLLD